MGAAGRRATERRLAGAGWALTGRQQVMERWEPRGRLRKVREKLRLQRAEMGECLGM